MPAYHAKSIDIRLSIADFDKTTTPSPFNTLCKEGILNADRAVKQFEDDAEYGTLSETPLRSEDGCRLGFLGDQQNMPFLMVHAKPKYLFNGPHHTVSRVKEVLLPIRSSAASTDGLDSPLTDLSSCPPSPICTLDRIGFQAGSISNNKQGYTPPRSSSKRQPQGTRNEDQSRFLRSPQVSEQTLIPGSAAVKPSADSPVNVLRPLATNLGETNSSVHQPQALCLRVVRTAKPSISTLESQDSGAHTAMKIDVYLNGELCTSSYGPTKVFQPKVYVRDTFSGIRNSRLTEKPWMLVPSLPDTLQASPNSAGVEEAAQNRWSNISQALQTAAQNYGRSPTNELPSIGRYLQSLAAVPFPAALLTLLQTNHRRFALIDVVVTTGKGNKDPADAAYLSRPMALRLHGYQLTQGASPHKNQGIPGRETSTIQGQSSRSKKSTADEQISMQPFSLHHVPRSSAGKSDCKNLSRENEAECIGDPSIYQAYRKAKSLGIPVAQLTNEHSTPATEGQTVLCNPPTSAPETLPRVRKTPGSQPRKWQGSETELVSGPRKRNPTPSLADTEVSRRSKVSTVSLPTKGIPPRKRRIQYHEVIDTRQTWAEEMEDITRQAADTNAIMHSSRRVTRSKLAKASDDVDIGEVSMAQGAGPGGVTSDQQAQPIVIIPSAPSLKVTASKGPPEKDHSRPDATQAPATSKTAILPPPSRGKRNSPPSSLPGIDTSSPEKPLILHHHKNLAKASNLPPSTTQRKHPASEKNPETPQPRSNKNTNTPSTLTNKLPSPSSFTRKPQIQSKKSTEWVIPALSKDSIITYPEGNVERQVRSERGGEFREEGFVVGVRFVVG
ncbi:MAG: hypothetical protein Q9219_002279 [cf. Caloplaca sp. 3 TL-2023]